MSERAFRGSAEGAHVGPDPSENEPKQGTMCWGCIDNVAPDLTATPSSLNTGDIRGSQLAALAVELADT
jgi:hypothetical protein